MTTVNKLSMLTCFLFLYGCAERKIDILDQKGKVVGGCVAGYDWHFYGLEDSIDYMLFKCAKADIENGNTISDFSLFKRDFTLPKAPEGFQWNKKLAMSYFYQDKISERKLGYILAEIEHTFNLAVISAEDELIQNNITQTEFDLKVSQAKIEWPGQ